MTKKTREDMQEQEKVREAFAKTLATFLIERKSVVEEVGIVISAKAMEAPVVQELLSLVLEARFQGVFTSLEDDDLNFCRSLARERFDLAYWVKDFCEDHFDQRIKIWIEGVIARAFEETSRRVFEVEAWKMEQVPQILRLKSGMLVRKHDYIKASWNETVKADQEGVRASSADVDVIGMYKEWLKNGWPKEEHEIEVGRKVVEKFMSEKDRSSILTEVLDDLDPSEAIFLIDVCNCRPFIDIGDDKPMAIDCVNAFFKEVMPARERWQNRMEMKILTSHAHLTEKTNGSRRRTL
jgi:hypothetical protein